MRATMILVNASVAMFVLGAAALSLSNGRWGFAAVSVALALLNAVMVVVNLRHRP
jgi:hypothetical protein